MSPNLVKPKKKCNPNLENLNLENLNLTHNRCYMSSNFVKPGPGWPENDVDIGKTYAAVQEVFAHLSAQVLYFVFG